MVSTIADKHGATPLAAPSHGRNWGDYPGGVVAILSFFFSGGGRPPRDLIGRNSPTNIYKKKKNLFFI